MEIVKFLTKKKKMMSLGDFTFDMLKEPNNYQGQEDIRFTLFDRNINTTCVMIDIDSFEYLHALRVHTKIDKLFGNYKYYIVFTGRGVHVYLPLKETVSKSELPHYKASYIGKCNELSDLLLTGEVDTQVFGSWKYGRLPHSVNGKNGKEVVFIRESHMPHATIGDLFERRELPKMDYVPPVETPKSVTDSPRYKYCNAVKTFKENAEKYTYDQFNKVMQIMCATREYDLIKHVTKGTKRESEADHFIGKTYQVTCDIVHKIFEAHDSPCVKCPHLYCKGSMPSLITGNRPTPSARHGFHTTIKKTVDKVTYSVPNYDNVVPIDVVNQYVNLNEDKLLSSDGFIYKFNDETGMRETLMHKTKIRYVTKQVFKDLKEIPKGRIATSKQLEETVRLLGMDDSIKEIDFGEFSTGDYVACSNGAYDYIQKKFIPYTPEMHILKKSKLNYNKDAKCPTFIKYLQEMLDTSSSYNLLKKFMGLAVSSIPNYKVQKYLWIYGLPSAGKSTILNVLNIICGDLAVDLPPLLTMKKKVIEVDLRGASAVTMDDIKVNFSARAWEDVTNSLVTGKKAHMRQMYIGPVKLPNFAGTLIVTSNDPPPIDSKEDGGYRRAMLLNMFKKPAHIDLLLLDKFEKEAEGILKWAIEGVEDFLDNGIDNNAYDAYYDGEKLYEEIGTEDKESILDDNMSEDSLQAYVDQKINFVSSGFKLTKDLYENYMDYCSVERVSCVTRNDFRRQIIKIISAHYRCTIDWVAHRKEHGRGLRGVEFK